MGARGIAVAAAITTAVCFTALALYEPSTDSRRIVMPTIEQPILAVGSEAAAAQDLSAAIGQRQPGSSPSSPPPRVWAVLVGIDRTPGQRTLDGAIGDATTIRDALVAEGIPEANITLLKDASASRGAILSSIDRLASVVPSGRAIFAFAGHTLRAGGTSELVAGDGARISAGELASALGRVQAPMWVSLSTCFAGAFSVTGIVGHNRVVTFASDADKPAYEAAWLRRSILVHYMVHKGMIGSRIPTIETAFDFAYREISTEYPSMEPSMVDGYPGDLSLRGELASARTMQAVRGGVPTNGSAQPSTPRPSARPAATPTTARTSLNSCGTVSYGKCN